MSLNPCLVHWQNQRVWIVGASSGIGAALAHRLLELGARVALSARRTADLERVARGFESRALVLRLDVTVSSDFSRALGQIREAWGGVDLVVFNAGTYQPVRAWDLNPTVACHILETNVLGVMAGVAAVVPQLMQQGQGGIALVASVAGYGGLPRSLVYGPSKAALINFAESLYLDLHPLGIGVTLINPGFVATPLTAQNDFRMPALITPEEAVAAILRGLARGRFEIHFPLRFSRFLKLLGLLPYGLYLRLMGRVVEKI